MLSYKKEINFMKQALSSFLDILISFLLLSFLFTFRFRKKNFSIHLFPGIKFFIYDIICPVLKARGRQGNLSFGRYKTLEPACRFCTEKSAKDFQ
jgi:hypothetical protein